MSVDNEKLLIGLQTAESLFQSFDSVTVGNLCAESKGESPLINKLRSIEFDCRKSLEKEYWDTFRDEPQGGLGEQGVNKRAERWN